MEYTKPWLPVEVQVQRLADHGLAIPDRERAEILLFRVGYYRLTGYLYPFRRSEPYRNAEGRERVRVLSGYREGTSLDHAVELIDFDRTLRLLVMDGIERIEIAVRMRIGYVLGRRGPFAHEDPSCFDDSFTSSGAHLDAPRDSKHHLWLLKVDERRAASDEQFVAHFRDKYEDRMPVWALTEILELGQLSRLYSGMLQADAEEVANAFGVPTKKLFGSWLASLNYVRNVAAHHSRLYNRRLQNAPGRPKKGKVPLLDHLHQDSGAKGGFGTYNALAVIAYLLRRVDPQSDWAARLAALLREFPASPALTVAALGVPEGWESLELWAGRTDGGAAARLR